jgi:hypothetical protein
MFWRYHDEVAKYRNPAEKRNVPANPFSHIQSMLEE